MTAQSYDQSPSQPVEPAPVAPDLPLAPPPLEPRLQVAPPPPPPTRGSGPLVWILAAAVFVLAVVVAALLVKPAWLPGGLAPTSPGPTITVTVYATPAQASSTAPAPADDTSAPPYMAFYSPSHNIYCEYAPDATVWCLMYEPAMSVQLAANGTFAVCTGEDCVAGDIGDVPPPVLAYGDTATVLAYSCTSAETGVTCTTNGKGFKLSKAGVVPVG